MRHHQFLSLFLRHRVYLTNLRGFVLQFPAGQPRSSKNRRMQNAMTPLMMRTMTTRYLRLPLLEQTQCLLLLLLSLAQIRKKQTVTWVKNQLFLSLASLISLLSKKKTIFYFCTINYRLFYLSCCRGRLTIITHVFLI